MDEDKRIGNLIKEMKQMGENAVTAKHELAYVTSKKKNDALYEIADMLESRMDTILKANIKDVRNARFSGMNPSLVDRLVLDEDRIRSMADGVRKIADMEDPVGKVISGSVRPNGLKISKVTVPIGVIAVIFEARPNVTSDAAALCLKAGNAVILRGGKEAGYSNREISIAMKKALENVGMPDNCIQLVEDDTRDSATILMKMNGYVDLLIPRGGAGLIKSVVANATIPVIETGTGNCHIYVDRDADINMAADIIFNAKTSRPSVCNACESLVIHKDIAKQALPVIYNRLQEKNVEVRGDEETLKILKQAVPATKEDWGKEYLDYIISVKVVDNIFEAISHISEYSTGHSECIVTDNYEAAEIFTSRIDSAAVYVNASTRFTDGGEFGYGAEIGISTQKLHARGPLGVEKLTSEKFIIHGNGQIR